MDSWKTKALRLEELLPLMEERLAAGQSLRFSPRGSSMLPMLREGRDSVVLSPLPEKLKKYDLPLYRREDGQFVLHRIVKAGESYTCMGDNQFEPEPGLCRSQMIALVTAFSHDGREHSVREPGYALYCRLWYHSRHLRRMLGCVKRTVKKILHRV